MLLNKLLINNGYIFIKNVNPSYIKTLVALGSKPIFVCIKDNKRIICIADRINVKYWFSISYCVNENKSYDYLNNINLYSLDSLSISEIKIILSNLTEDSYNNIFPTNVEFYFFAYL